jgi:5-methylthioribose kinase
MQLVPDNRAAIEARLLNLGWIAAGERLISLESAGAGNMNTTLRATLPQRSLILKQSLPYVARYPQIPAPIERSDVEAAFYQAVTTEADLAARMPALIGYDPENHMLALQDLGSAADCSSHYSLTQTDALPVAALLTWLGKLHGLNPASVENRQIFDNFAMRKLNHQHIFEIPFEADNGVSLPLELQQTASRFTRDRALKTRAAELGEHYLTPGERMPDARLLHGDYYPGSWLQTSGNLYIIDVEFAFIGPVEFDLGVFLAHNVMTGSPPETVSTLLEHYPQTVIYNQQLVLAFAAVEIIRRLLGVAQLPLAASDTTKLHWLDWSREQLR